MKEFVGLEDALQLIIQEEIVARFGRLAQSDIWRKSDGDMVTRADLAAEVRIGELLRAVRPGSIVIAEEAVSADPSLLLKTSGASVWIVDPLDSTLNFCSGNPDFSTLIAYCEEGEICQTWTVVPMRQTVAMAVSGGGAFINGKLIKLSARKRDRPIVAFTHPAFRTIEDDYLLTALRNSSFSPLDSRGAGVEYVALVTGEIDAAVFTWEKPWDHCAGALLVREAGAIHTDRNGHPFKPAGGNALPLVAAASRDIADDLLASINGYSEHPDARQFLALHETANVRFR